MKFILPCYDYDFQQGYITGTINGGTVWLWHIMHSLWKHGHAAEMICTQTEKPEGDVMIIQSEWTGGKAFQNFDGIKIVLLGHFANDAYPDPKKIKADLFLTTWKGDCVEGFNAHFWPHAYSADSDDGEIYHVGRAVWLGNTYWLRMMNQKEWINGLPLSLLRGKHPKYLPGIYRGADVCPNIHGDFQKGIISDHPSRIADKSGYAMNERFWEVIGAGGTLVTDYHSQALEFFDQSDLIMCNNSGEFREKVMYYYNHPLKGKQFYEKARRIVLEKHTYYHRVAELLKLIDA